MVQFFVLGVQYCTELRVSLSRIDAFLGCEEPPIAVHQGDGPMVGKSHAGARTVASYESASTATSKQPGAVALRGADYDWQRPLGHIAILPSDTSASEKQQDTSPAPKTVPTGANGRATVVQAAGLTLDGVQFELQPGELLGVCGDVGAGKSSLLAALLGELLPLPAGASTNATPAAETASLNLQSPPLHEVVVVPRVGDAAAGSRGPFVCGRVAYCSQVSTRLDRAHCRHSLVYEIQMTFLSHVPVMPCRCLGL